MNKTQKKLLEYCYYLLSRRRYTTTEILRKLKRKNTGYLEPADAGQIQEIIDYLIEKKYLNDQEYISFYIDGPAQRKHYGSRRIKNELNRKGLKTDLIKAQLIEKNYQEKILAENFLTKKYETNTLKNLDQKSRAKIFRQLNSRGFSSATVYGILKNISSK